MSPGINNDPETWCVVDTNAMAWEASPSPGVWRKRLFLDGAIESGRVTSLVRFEPGARFPAHGHPNGEEYFVLSGVFTDEDGDWPSGYFVLNPDGSRHAPSTAGGCEIFVRLQQNPGTRAVRRQDSGALQWSSTAIEGVKEKLLYDEAGFPERVSLLQVKASDVVLPVPEGGLECFVLSGALTVNSGDAYAAGTWLRAPTGTRLHVGATDCVLYVRAHGAS